MTRAFVSDLGRGAHTLANAKAGSGATDGRPPEGPRSKVIVVVALPCPRLSQPIVAQVLKLIAGPKGQAAANLALWKFAHPTWCDIAQSKSQDESLQMDVRVGAWTQVWALCSPRFHVHPLRQASPCCK